MEARISKAAINDHSVLTDITQRSKAHWGYSGEQMEKWRNVLTISKTYIEINNVYKLVVTPVIAGYYSYYSEDVATIKLDNLFILPDYMGKGLGKLLLDDFIMRAKKDNAKSIILESDPNAETFYAKHGFVTTGQAETGTTGRYLPIMELDLFK